MNSNQPKLFVGGISWETDEVVLREHFQSYGVVARSAVARDRYTQNPRGFGFVWFSDSLSADKALKEKNHVILGRTVEVKKAFPISEKAQHEQQHRGSHKNSRMENINDQSRTKKIFVGGLSANLTEDDFKGYFEKFGQITDVVVMHDSVTNRPRGFGFITFDSVESVDYVMRNNFHELNGRRVEVKRAVPKEGNFSSEHASNTRTRGVKGPLPNINIPLYYPYYGSSYGVYPGYTPFLFYGGLGVDFYGSNLYGSWYPMGSYGIGHEVPSVASRGPWYDPKFSDVRMFPTPYNNALIHPVYPSKGTGLSDTLAGNGIVDTGDNVKLNQTINGNRGISADAVPFQIKYQA